MNTVKLIGLGCCMLFGLLLNPIDTVPEYIHVVFAEETTHEEITEIKKEITSVSNTENIEDFSQYLQPIDTSNIEETYLSKEIQNACIEIGNIYNICPEFIMAIIESESSGNPFATNGKCEGLMQIYVKYHLDRMKRLGVTNIYDVYGNILVGVDYLAELFEKYDDSAMVLMVYNGDSSAWDYWNENGDISKYANKILNRSYDLERLHGK